MEFLSAATDPLVGHPMTPRWRVLGATLLLSLAVGIVAFEALIAEHSQRTAARKQLTPQARLSSLPIAAQGVVSATLGADDRSYRITAASGAFQARNAEQGLRMRFDASGVRIRSGETRVGLSLQAWSDGGSRHGDPPIAPSAKANRVTYARAGLSEWYSNGPLGLEQGFTIPRAPSGHPAGPLTLSMLLTGNARASLAADGRSLTFARTGGLPLTYSGLITTDARGRTLHSWLELHADQLLLRVDSQGARYPLRIDPFIQLGPKLAGSGEIGQGSFGNSVAVSANGNVALIGGFHDNGGVGAAWVFRRSGSTWAQQGPKLTGAGESGEGLFGTSVALSSNGSTALIGGEDDNGGLGAVWVLTRSGSTWAQQGPKFTGAGKSGEGLFGTSVSVSESGDTALIGGEEAAWVFRRSGSTWAQQGRKLTGEGSRENHFGSDVALSSDGNTALIGGRGGVELETVGGAWVFTRSGSTWTEQGPKLTGGEERGFAGFGTSVALCSRGDTALIGGTGDSEFRGAAWVFTRSGSTWTQQGPKLTGGEENPGGAFGASVALSAIGDTALVGGEAAWVFRRSDGIWTQQGAKLVPSDASGESGFATRVALSARGNTALIGGPGDSHLVGATWPFVNHPRF